MSGVRGVFGCERSGAGHLLALLFAQVLVGFAFVVVAVVVVVVVVDRLRLFAGLRYVGLLVEVIEQEIEENGVWHGEPHGPPRVSAVGPQQLRIVQESHAELDLLPFGGAHNENKRQTERRR